jgi:hypothetical protein
VFGDVRTTHEFWHVRCRVASRFEVSDGYVLMISDITVIVIVYDKRRDSRI